MWSGLVPPAHVMLGWCLRTCGESRIRRTITLTQASLSPDLSGAVGASPAADAHAQTGRNSESALWVTALAASGLLAASVLLVGVLARSASTDASFGGFVSGVSIMIAAFGVGTLAYVLVTARRQGLLGAERSEPSAERAIPSGMHEVPALPAEMGRRKRRQMQAERSDRSRQAKAIATVASAAPKAHPATPPAAEPRPIAPRPMDSPQAKARPLAPPVARPRPAAPRAPIVTRPAPRQAVVERPNPRPTPVARQASPPAQVTRPVPIRAVPVRPAIRMPGPQVRQPRPGAWPTRAPVVRMATPPAMPRTRVVLQQVNAANVRMQAPPVRS